MKINTLTGEMIRTTKPVVELKRSTGTGGLMYRVVMYATIPGEERPVPFNVDYSFRSVHGSDAGQHVLYVDAPQPEEFGYADHQLSDDDREWKRYNRLAIAIKKEFAFPHFKEAMDALGLGWLPDISKYKYSRKAGCSCGCSPGFTTSGVRRGLYIFVDVERVN